MSVDILVLAPHPDDAELCCGGLLLKARDAGLSFAIVDCTRGEMGTRGSVARRAKEAAAADRILRTRERINLKLRDGHLRDDEPLRVALVRALRRFRPRLVLAPHWEDQHPDHAAVGGAAEPAAWLCGAPKFDPRTARGVASPDRPPYRPARILYYNNRYGIDADLVLDISAVFEEKMKLTLCYGTQFGPGKRDARGKGNAPLTRLSSAQFLDFLRAMHGHYGFKINAPYGEPYCVKGPVALDSVESLLGNKR
ncbi:MAG: bacillithiol biosynthesis deacetylase BshB1 [Planctomycetota bacterium]|nr:bacillithiol biosynthesis deacetylase BshB1 [Planctomycetota bacterium]